MTPKKLSRAEKQLFEKLEKTDYFDSSYIYIDEFTSVVNRQVAKAASCAIAKCVRRNQRKFIAVSCHDDIIEWLCPDWIYNTDTHSFFGQAVAKDRQSKLMYTKLGGQTTSGNAGRFLKSITI